MYWIGLTGGIACGKSSVAKILNNKNISVLSADKLVHDLLKDLDGPVYKQILLNFGKLILTPKGEIDRKILGKLVFSDKIKLNLLEKIIHPEIQSKVLQVKEAWKKLNKKVGVYEIPLLFEKNRQKDFDYILCISCSKEMQISRLMERRSCNRSEAKQIISNQLSLKHKEENSDFVLRNDGSFDDLNENVNKWLVDLVIPKC